MKEIEVYLLCEIVISKLPPYVQKNCREPNTDQSVSAYTNMPIKVQNMICEHRKQRVICLNVLVGFAKKDNIVLISSLLLMVSRDTNTAGVKRKPFEKQVPHKMAFHFVDK